MAFNSKNLFIAIAILILLLIIGYFSLSGSEKFTNKKTNKFTNKSPVQAVAQKV